MASSGFESARRRIQRRPIRWSALAALSALGICSAAPGAYQRELTQLADRVVARVNAQAIALSEVEESVVRRRLADPQARQMSLRQLFEEELRSLIDEELLVQAAEKMNVEAPEEVLAAQVDQLLQRIERGFGSEAAMREALSESGFTLDKLRADLRQREARQLKITQAISTRFTVTDAEVEEYAKKLRAEGKPTVSLHLRHILIRCPPDADPKTVKKAQTRAFDAALAAQGKMTFEEAAQRFSDDKETRDSGGDLGYVNEGTMAPALEEAAKLLEVGKVSQPARSDNGFHVLLLVNKRTPRKMLFAERFEAERKKWLEELHRTQTVEMQMDFLKEIPE